MKCIFKLADNSCVLLKSCKCEKDNGKNSQSEELISLRGHITGVKREVKILGTSVYKLEKKIENVILVNPLWA
jgi:hypothetical protein